MKLRRLSHLFNSVSALKLAHGATTLFLALGAAIPAYGANSFSTEYTVFALGLPIGKSSFQTTLTDEGYIIKGVMKAAGVASLFSSMSGDLTVSGVLNADNVQSQNYVVNYREGAKAKSTTIRFAKGTVAKAVNSPKPRPKANWIEHKDGAMNGTIDPISAMLIPAAGAKNVCNRTLKVFDGVMRADMKLSYLRTIPFSVDGFKGNAITCRLNFVPVSGYEPTKKDLIYMRDKGAMEITFAPIDGTTLYGPVMAKASTRIGQVSVRATRFSSNN